MMVACSQVMRPGPLRHGGSKDFITENNEGHREPPGHGTIGRIRIHVADHQSRGENGGTRYGCEESPWSSVVLRVLRGKCLTEPNQQSGPSNNTQYQSRTSQEVRPT